jgi:hypothetical protein
MVNNDTLLLAIETAFGQCESAIGCSDSHSPTIGDAAAQSMATQDGNKSARPVRAGPAILTSISTPQSCTERWVTTKSDHITLRLRTQDLQDKSKTIPLLALWDTGASMTVVRRSIAERAHAEIRALDSPIEFEIASNETLKLSKVVELEMSSVCSEPGQSHKIQCLVDDRCAGYDALFTKADGERLGHRIILHCSDCVDVHPTGQEKHHLIGSMLYHGSSIAVSQPRACPDPSNLTEGTISATLKRANTASDVLCVVTEPCSKCGH